MEVLGAVLLVVIFARLLNNSSSAAPTPQQTLYYAQNNLGMQGQPLQVPQTVDYNPLLQLPPIPLETLQNLPVSDFNPPIG